ncbi:MAG: hypothetical protein ACYDEN_02000 [Acidimicrobiales bacterium]
MALLRDRGVSVRLPPGFEGRIFCRPAVGGAVPETVVHCATFPVPAGAGDFGGGATPAMRANDVLVVLFEYGQESVGRPLFRAAARPRPVQAGELSPFRLQRGVQGQAGGQWFFTEAGRPWSLYVVIGSYGRRGLLVGRVNELLAGVELAA